MLDHVEEQLPRHRRAQLLDYSKFPLDQPARLEELHAEVEALHVLSFVVTKNVTCGVQARAETAAISLTMTPHVPE